MMRSPKEIVVLSLQSPKVLRRGAGSWSVLFAVLEMHQHVGSPRTSSGP